MSFGAPNAEARFVAPWTPPERMWGGLARSIMMAMSFSGPLTPRSLLRHLECTGAEIPQWLRDEPEMQHFDHALSKGTRCVLIYRAMLWDGRSQHLTPSGHTRECQYHVDQYPHECDCGATLKAWPASVDRSPKGQDAEERLDRNDESAVAKPDAPKGSERLSQ